MDFNMKIANLLAENINRFIELVYNSHDHKSSLILNKLYGSFESNFSITRSNHRFFHSQNSQSV